MISILAFLGGLALMGAAIYIRQTSNRSSDDWGAFLFVGFILCVVSLIVAAPPH